MTMLPAIRRIIVTDAHRRRTGCCPVLLHSLGTGESFDVQPLADGFVDVESGLRARSRADGVAVATFEAPIELHDCDDVACSGYDPASRERFIVRAGGGTSVTLFAGAAGEHYQFAIVDRT